MQHVLASLDHFAACRELSVHGGGEASSVDDCHPYALLCHPVTRTCQQLRLHDFARGEVEQVPVDKKQKQPDDSVRVTRSMKRKRDAEQQPSRTREFSWANIRLPAHYALASTAMTYIQAALYS